MIATALEVLQRVQDLIDPRERFFEVVSQWYKNAQSTLRIMRVLLGKSGRARLALIVNGHQLVAEAPGMDAGTRLWELPARMLRAGDNEVAVWLDSDRTDLHVLAAAIGDEQAVEREVLDLTVANPPDTRGLRLDQRLHAVHAGKHWVVGNGGCLSFQVRLAAARPVLFSVKLLVDRTEATLADIKEIIEDVRDRVKEKKAELEKERAQQLKSDRRLDTRQVEGLNDAIDSLKAYLTLHDLQIAPAFTGGDAGALAGTIARTGNPDSLVQRCVAPLQVRPAPAAPAAAPLVRPVAPPPAPVASLPPLVRPASPPPRPAARGFGIVKLFKLTIFSTVVAAGIGYAAYATGNLPRPVEEWVDRAIAKVKSWIPGRSVDVMTALRQSARELGWKPDAEQQFSAAKIKEMIQMFAGLIDKNATLPALDDDVRLYRVGERLPNMPALGGELKDLPIPCRRELLVFDLRRAETAASYFDLMRKNLTSAGGGDMARKMGVKFVLVPLNVPGTDGAYAVRASSSFGRIATQSFARRGPFLLGTTDAEPLPEGSEIQEIEHRLTVLAAKLPQSSARTEPGTKQPEPKGEHKGVLGVPMPFEKR